MSSIILEARDIRYRYPRGMEAISGISFHIRKKEKIALVGPNGAGKSTLLTMFNGMIRPDSGILLFDNEPVCYDAASLRILRKRVGFVLQNPDRQIIAPTVFQDVAFGPTNLGYNEAEVRDAVTHALRHAGLEGFERRPPHQLSGGQKQRVAIARALAVDPEILVFDDALSAVDTETEERILEALLAWRKGRTNIIVSNRVSTLRHADRIAVLDSGRLAQYGTHKELLLQDGFYSEIARLQALVREGGASGESKDKAEAGT